MMHICVSKLAIIGSDNGLSLDRRQAIIWTNSGILLIGPMETNFSEILIEIYVFLFEKVHLKMSSGNWRPSCLGLNVLTHWGRVTHICVCNLIIIGSDNGLSPDRRQAIIWTNAGLLSIGPLRTHFSENLFKMQQFSLKKMHLKMSSAKRRPFCLGLNVLSHTHPQTDHICRSIPSQCVSTRHGFGEGSSPWGGACMNEQFRMYCKTYNTIYKYSVIIIRITHWDRDKVAVIVQTKFSNAFPWMKMNEFRIKFH